MLELVNDAPGPGSRLIRGHETAGAAEHTHQTTQQGRTLDEAYYHADHQFRFEEGYVALTPGSASRPELTRECDDLFVR